MSEDRDRLLHVLSARGLMSWDSFRRAFDTLLQQAGGTYSSEQKVAPKKAMQSCIRALDGMGYCEFDFRNENKVFVAPPLLARLPRAGFVVAVLTGARTPALIGRVHDAAKSNHARVRAMPPRGDSFGVPSSIFVESSSTVRLRQLSANIGIEFPTEPPAWTFAHFAGSVSEYLSSLDFLPASEPDWSKSGYDSQALSFTGFEEADSRLSLSRHELHGRWTYAVWKDGRRAAADLDWARYAVASERSQQLVAYDPQTLVFAVPAPAPVPKPLNRALSLCSGNAPLSSFSPGVRVDIRKHRRFFSLYQGVPQAIAELVAAKLGQDLKAARYRKGELSDG